MLKFKIQILLHNLSSVDIPSYNLFPGVHTGSYKFYQSYNKGY